VNGIEEFRLLVLADPHYAGRTYAEPTDPDHYTGLGCELVRRAIEDAQRRGGFDAIALMGDLLQDGGAPYADSALRRLGEQIEQAAPQAPLLVVPGNHDGDPQRLLGTFKARDGLHRLGGYRFFVFADAYGENEVAHRNAQQRWQLLDEAARGGEPIVVLQHSLVYPQIVDEYPYMLGDWRRIADDYARAGVLLSISGHYHDGLATCEYRGTKYVTAPAVHKPPFVYLLVRLAARQVDVERRELRLDEALGVVDCHCHTQFAYCAQDVTAEGVISRARAMGLAGVCLTEHAPQLYCPREGFWDGGHVRNPDLWRRSRAVRMPQYRQAMDRLRNEYVRVGLEVELDADGELTVHDDDRRWADVLVGAVHWLPQDHGRLDDRQFERAFMRTSEALIEAGVDILAHPFRVFRWADRPIRAGLYDELAQALAEGGVAAELNFHANSPDRQFVRCCLQRGVRIALGSDAHRLDEAANLAAHVRLVRCIAGTRDVGRYLWR